jgi:hypothetical protein
MRRSLDGTACVESMGVWMDATAHHHWLYHHAINRTLASQGRQLVLAVVWG